VTAATTRGGAPSDVSDHRILVVDDEQSIRDAIGRFLRARGFEVHVADTAAAALERLQTSRFAALLCDVRMPGASGMELLPQVRRIDPDLAVLMLTGLNDAATATEALSHGAMDYLLKPIELDRLEIAIGTALRKRREHIEQRDVAQLVREEVSLRTAELEREKLALRGLTVSVLEGIVTLMEAKDPYRAGHSQRVAALAGAVAQTLRLDNDAIGHVTLAARLHDIGKVALPEAILLKPAPLTPTEYEAVRQHVGVGVQILAPIKHFAPALPFVRDHHERWDGSGYPSRLRGEDISVGGRILAAADAFVAVTAGRPYFTALPPTDALPYLAHYVGTYFDPAVFRVLQQVVRVQLG
jgi:response regulator RpfG family c-di-GMP phosphodiesterase